MGSCSSGGPNKYSGMCLVKSGDATKESEDLARAVGHPVLSSNLKRPGYSCGERRADLPSARMHFTPSNSKTSTKPLRNNDARLRATESSAADGGSSVRNRHSLDETRRPNFLSSVDSSNDFRRKDDSRLLPTFGYDQPVDSGALPTDEHSSSVADCSKASADSSTMERRDSEAVSPPIPSNRTAMNEVDARRQQRYDGRKASAPVQCYRWPGEYSNCIVPPPNKTVFDAYASPCAQSDYVADLAWTGWWGDQKASSCSDHDHYKPTVSGSDTSEKTSPLELLPSRGLSAASISSSYCQSSSTASSSSVDSSLFRRRGSGGSSAKRSSSVSGGCPSSSTTELLPSTSVRATEKGHCKTDTEHVLRRNTASENRPLPASQRLWNLLRSPMEPLNGGNVGSSRKYAPLNSDSISQSDGLDVSNTVSNKNSGLDRAT